MKGKELVPGEFVEITENINAIPAGVYRFEQIIDGAYCFSVGRTKLTGFMVSEQGGSLLEPVEASEGQRIKTSCFEFIDRYSHLCREKRSESALFDPNQPFTWCWISEDYAQEAH